MFRKILSVGAWTLVSRLTGFIRDVVMAAILGAGPVADAFFVAFRLPNHFRAIFAEGAFAAAFVPAYARTLEQAGLPAAKLFADQIAATPDFELTTPASLALLTFRYRPAGLDEPALDALNERLLHALNDGGQVYLTQTRVRGRYVIRFAVGQRSTTHRHVQQAWRLIQQTARGLLAQA